MYDSTFTFKTRRRYHLHVLTCLVVLVHQVAAMAVPIQCPAPCECYLNSNGIQSARCTELYENQSPFLNIHVLVVQANETENECNIPKNIAKILPQLNYLYMVNCSLNRIPSGVFEELHLLQEVDLSNNYIEKLDPSMFVNNSKLLYANLQNNPLHIVDEPFLISKSLQELDLQSCGIQEIPHNMFKKLTRMRTLTLSDNRLKTIDENTLPNSLRYIYLNKNYIKNVPTAEVLRLRHIKEIDLSANPINCTCLLVEFEKWSPNKAAVFKKSITCAHPRQFAGQKLIDLPQYELCNAKMTSETDLCGDNHICTNQILPEDGTIKKNDVKEYFERDEVLPVNKNNLFDYMEGVQSDSNGDAEEGSGDGTDSPMPIRDINEDDKQKITSSETPPIVSSEPPSKVIDLKNKPEEGNKVTSEAKTVEGASETPKEDPKPEVAIINKKPIEVVTEKDNSVTSYKAEISSLSDVSPQDVNQTNNSESAIVPVAVPTEPSNAEPDQAKKTEPEEGKSPESLPEGKITPLPTSEPKKQDEIIPEVPTLPPNDSQSNTPTVEQPDKKEPDAVPVPSSDPPNVDPNPAIEIDPDKKTSPETSSAGEISPPPTLEPKKEDNITTSSSNESPSITPTVEQPDKKEPDAGPVTSSEPPNVDPNPTIEIDPDKKTSPETSSKGEISPPPTLEPKKEDNITTSSSNESPSITPTVEQPDKKEPDAGPVTSSEPPNVDPNPAIEIDPDKKTSPETSSKGEISPPPTLEPKKEDNITTLSSNESPSITPTVEQPDKNGSDAAPVVIPSESPTIGQTFSTSENTTPEVDVTSKPTSEHHSGEVGAQSTSNSESSLNMGYIIPFLAILIVIIICLGVYLGQRSSRKKNWEDHEQNTNSNTEMQDVLLPDTSKTPVVKYYNKYSSETNPEQTARLIDDSPHEAHAENGNANRDKLSNGQSCDQNEPIECAIAKVTTLPDSIPRTPIIRNNT